MSRWLNKLSLELLKNKENGIHTAVETCGYAEKSKYLKHKIC
ncbi:MAG: hypothetical protein ACLR56_14860 [Oscillospiraceae bacterium]